VLKTSGWTYEEFSHLSICPQHPMGNPSQSQSAKNQRGIDKKESSFVFFLNIIVGDTIYGLHLASHKNTIAGGRRLSKP